MISGLWEKSAASLVVEECDVQEAFIEVCAKKALSEKTKKKSVGFLMGEIMKECQGKADPQELNLHLKNELSKA